MFSGSGGSVGIGRRRRPAAAAMLAVLAGLLITATGPATPSATLTVRLVPGAISAGQRGLSIVTFHNLSAGTLSNVVVNLRFPHTLSQISAPGCKRLKTPGAVACAFGDIASGGTQQAFVSAKLASHVPANQRLSVGFTLRVGPGNPKPIITSASAVVLGSTDAANKGNCLAKPSTLTAVLDKQVTSLPSPPVADPKLKLPCTPLSVAVLPKPPSDRYKTKIASVDVPKLKRPAIVKLTFPNETLPDEKWIDNIPPGRTPGFDNPNPLWTYDPAHPEAKRVVPKCKAGPTLPTGWKTCVIRVHAVDPFGDLDKGSITLLVQGTGVGDPRYVG